MEPPLEWEVLVDPPLPGVRNMARDHALAAMVRPGRGALRLYRWAEPTISFGRNEPARGLWDRRRAEEDGVRFVRRPTGGRAVVHERELTYALVLPLRALGGLRPTYRRVNEALRRGLARLGADTEIAPSGPDRQLPPDAGPCFRVPAAGELVVDGRKLVGSAQARVDGALLQHGSLLIDDDQGRLRALSREPLESQAPATLHEVLGAPPDAEGLVEAIRKGFEEELGGSWRSLPAGTELSEETRWLERYASDAWTWRR